MVSQRYQAICTGTMTRMPELVLPFRLRGVAGRITVGLDVNDDPTGWGCDLLTQQLPADAARGFPVCRAEIDHPARGYAAALGWLQLVRSSDSDGDPSKYEMDPISIYRDVATPFAFFGFKPVLFDAPFRESTYPLTWRARSYLCAAPDAVMTKRVSPVAAFAWGFDVVDGRVRLLGPESLDLTSWNAHLSLLASEYPAWRFDPAAAAEA
ncbi:MAG: hypothetical protein QOD50_2273 [Actinomycetota bacterium]|nr:hypothetical protein [Actinomycetota bacterium]